MNKKLAKIVKQEIQKKAKGHSKELLDALQEYKKGCERLLSYFESLDDNSIFFDKAEKNNINYKFIPGLSIDDSISEINKFIAILKNEEKKKEQEQQSKTKTIYSVELFNSDGDTETSTDCNSYDEAIKEMENYKKNKTQYVDSWGLSGKGRIIKFTQDEDGNMSNEKVLKTFWL